MARARNSTRGPQAFDKWYQEQWGDRWESLSAALLLDTQHVAWWNPFVDIAPAEVLPSDATPWAPHPMGHSTDQGATASLLEAQPSAVPLQPCWTASSFAPPPPDPMGRPAYYLLDGASVLAAAALDVQPGDRVLDLCAAPGGKSLYLAVAASAEGSLVANELSRKRYERLKRVLHGYLPADWCDNQIRTTNHDATRWCLYQRAQYDRVLLDAPCSSERHVLQSPKDLATWSPARSKQLAQRQYAMLASALEVVCVGGWVAYCTCSISQLECDQIIEKLHKKRKGRFRVAMPPWPHGEETAFGRWLLPDQQPGWGPMYIALLQRLD